MWKSCVGQRGGRSGVSLVLCVALGVVWLLFGAVAVVDIAERYHCC